MVCAALEEAVRGFGEAVRLSSRRFGGKTQSLVTWMHEEVSSPHVQCSEHQNARTKSTHPRAWPRPHVNLKHAYRGGVAGGWSGAGRLGQRPTCRYGDGPPPPSLLFPTQHNAEAGRGQGRGMRTVRAFSLVVQFSSSTVPPLCLPLRIPVGPSVLVLFPFFPSRPIFSVSFPMSSPCTARRLHPSRPSLEINPTHLSFERASKLRV